MKTAMVAAIMACRMACFVGAAIVMLNGKPGWGWLIFAGLFTGITIDTGSSK